MKLMFTFLTALFLFFQTPDLENLRNSYSKANNSLENTKAFIDLAESKSSADPVIKGYQAAAKIMEAKVSKKGRPALVKSGATQLESIIKDNPNNIELRLIRLSVQENIPKIVGYNSALKGDKQFILAQYSKQNAALKSHIRKFAAQSKTMTAAEKNALR